LASLLKEKVDFQGLGKKEGPVICGVRLGGKSEWDAREIIPRPETGIEGSNERAGIGRRGILVGKGRGFLKRLRG